MPLNHGNLRNAQRDARNQLSSKVVNKARGPISSTMEYAPYPKKFTEPKLKYFYGESDWNYYIMDYRNAKSCITTMMYALAEWFDIVNDITGRGDRA